MEPMVKVRVLKDFYDRQADHTLRKAGEEYETFSSRARELERKQLVAVIREPNIHEIPEDDVLPVSEASEREDLPEEDSDPEE